MVLLDLHYKAVLVERTVDLILASGGGGGGGGYYGGGGGAGGHDGYNGSSDPAKDRNLAAAVLEVLVISFLLAQELQVHLQENLILIGYAGDFEQDSGILIDPTYINITTQPSGSAVSSGSTVSLSIVAEVVGVTSPTINYQWQKKSIGQDGFVDISGANSSSYTTPSLVASIVMTSIDVKSPMISVEQSIQMKL